VNEKTISAWHDGPMSETTDGTDLPESNVFAKPWPLDLGTPCFTAVAHAPT